MAGIAPGLDGYIAAQQLGQQRQQAETGALMQLLQVQNQMEQAAQAREMRPLQMEALRSQIASRNATAQQAQRQQAAQGALSSLLATGGYQGALAAPTAVASSDDEALRIMREADAKGIQMGVNVPNQQNVKALTSMAFPAEFGKAQAAALFPKPVVPTTPRQNIVPVTGGYLQPNATGAMEFVRTQQQGEGRAEPAPVVKDIIDPSDPKRLISIDVRKYRGGTLGAEGVIGIAGREPTAQKKSELLDVGRQEIDRDVITLKNALDSLKSGGGITSTSKGVPSNVMAWTANTGVGQTLGQMGGTQNQKARDVISQARPLLLRSIMQATGMSAKNLASNAELKLWLSTATDPTKGYEANIEALNNIAEKYGTGGFIPTEKSKPIGGMPAPTAAPTAPSTGIRFLGFENGPSR